MAITFGSVTQIQYKITFLERTHHYFSNDVIHLPGITDVHYFIEESANLTEGKTRHWLERYHFVVSTLALGLKINFDQPIKWMEFQK